MAKITKKQNNHSLENQIEETADKLTTVRQEISKVIYGQDDVIDLILTTVLAGGHGLLVGVPGLAKTLLVDTMGTVLGLNSKRIQCTPDLMPSDIIGSEILEENKSGTRSFRFIEGPVFTNLLMSDEINRASPRTQSALLQAMQEHFISVNGVAHSLPKPFHVLATQNPLEQEGTYPLPEAQLDRFLLQIDVDYPSLDAERDILIHSTGGTQAKSKKILKKGDLLKMQELACDLPVGEKVLDSILKLVRSLRPETGDDVIQNSVLWAPGPRASQALLSCARAYALLHGRYTPSLDDVEKLAYPVLQHRMALSSAAQREGITLQNLIKKYI